MRSAFSVRRLGAGLGVAAGLLLTTLSPVAAHAAAPSSVSASEEVTPLGTWAREGIFHDYYLSNGTLVTAEYQCRSNGESGLNKGSWSNYHCDKLTETARALWVWRV
ncbi:hypothetical protein [Streptosporangium carneum]|uniref:Uncharacterized protein n=1 Tax=Streptosporangium carneum TaxID=47481 RepID=A0A9W6MCM9_9ACTN|nr:hypothetical protein [Streptosporangium carneum]GLK08908.1 hypothetical protein GCM10017600_23130 [Streptosporangium carneum]